MNQKTSYITKVAILSAIAFILMFLEFNIPIVAPWLKFDISDVPALFAGFSLGPVAGVIVEAIKCILFFAFRNSGTGGVGELANFLMGIALVLPAALIYKKKMTRKFSLIGMGTGLLSTTIAAGLLNYFVLIPLYSNVMPIEAIISICAELNPAIDSILGYVFYMAMPWTLLKCAVECAIVFVLYKKLSPILHKT